MTAKTWIRIGEKEISAQDSGMPQLYKDVPHSTPSIIALDIILSFYIAHLAYCISQIRGNLC